MIMLTMLIFGGVNKTVDYCLKSIFDVLIVALIVQYYDILN